MTKDARDLMDYLQNKIPKIKPNISSHAMISLIDEIKDEFCTLFCGKGFKLDGNQLEINRSGIELLQNYFGVGGHKIEINNDEVKIGCKTFSFAFLREIIKLHKDDIRIDDAWVHNKHINIFFEANKLGVRITDAGFKCEEYEIAIETVEGWIK